jgi:serine protease Do
MTSLLCLPLALPTLTAEKPTAGGRNMGSPIAALEAVSSAFSDVAKRVTPTVVTIETMYRATAQPQHPMFRQWAPQRQRQVPRGSGSGVIYDHQGHIITNAHVIADASSMEVVLSDGRRIEATLVGQDPKTDLAVIKVDPSKTDLVKASYGNSDHLDVGDWVIAIGNPLGFSHTVTHGIVSAKSRSGLRNDLEGAYEDFIQTDASINQGNSGGPLCNLYGEVIGINSMIASQSGGSQGLGFAIPINMARRIVDQLINTGEVQRGFLGVLIKDMTLELAQQFGSDSHEGALVDEVMPDGPAERGGIQSGDIVVALNGESIKNSMDLRNNISQTSPESEVNLKLVRDGKTIDLKVKLGSLEKTGNGGDLLGMRVQPMDPQAMERYRVENGVIIEEVAAGSPSSEAGLKPQMVVVSVDRKPVLHPDDFNRLVSESLKGDDDAVLLYVRTATHGFYLVVKVEE